MRRWWGICCLTLAAGVLAASAGESSARAAPLGACTAQTGTIVAVDFAHWGGPIVRGCGIDQPSGYALLHAAGFTTTGDEHDGPAFICRIGDQAFHHGTQYPTPNEDACINTPPTSAYWSYWIAPAGQSTWSYSPLGPMGDVPKPGEVELWTFGATNVAGTSGWGVPRFSPKSLRAQDAPVVTMTTSPQTTPTSTPTTATNTTATHPAIPAKGTSSKRPATSAAAHPSTHRPATRPTRRSPAGAPRRSTAAARPSKARSPRIVAARPTDQRTSAGSAVPLVMWICLALLLCGGAGWAIWRRRQYE